MKAGDHQGQKKVSDFLDLEFRGCEPPAEVMGTEFRPFERAVYTLTPLAISLAHSSLFSDR